MRKYLPVVILLTTVFGMLSFYIARGVIASITKKADSDAVTLDSKKEQWYISFQNKSVEGEKIILKEIKAEFVLINFWASWCGPCLKELPELVKLREKISEKKLYILGINCDMDNGLKEYKKIKLQYQINFPNVLDPRNKSLDAIGSSTLPVTLLYKDGRLVYSTFKQTSFLAEEFLKRFE